MLNFCAVHAIGRRAIKITNVPFAQMLSVSPHDVKPVASVCAPNVCVGGAFIMERLVRVLSVDLQLRCPRVSRIPVIRCRRRFVNVRATADGSKAREADYEENV